MNMGNLENTETVKKKETILCYYCFKGTVREKMFHTMNQRLY